MKVAEKIGKKGNYVKIVSVNFRVARLDERVTKTKGFKVSRFQGFKGNIMNLNTAEQRGLSKYIECRKRRGIEPREIKKKRHFEIKN